jgi:hypothetical protein
MHEERVDPICQWVICSQCSGTTRAPMVPRTHNVVRPATRESTSCLHRMVVMLAPARYGLVYATGRHSRHNKQQYSLHSTKGRLKSPTDNQGELMLSWEVKAAPMTSVLTPAGYSDWWFPHFSSVSRQMSGDNLEKEHGPPPTSMKTLKQNPPPPQVAEAFNQSDALPRVHLPDVHPAKFLS